MIGFAVTGKALRRRHELVGADGDDGKNRREEMEKNGDDAGLTGMGDPFCRGTYPWGKEDKELQAEIRRVIRTRNQEPALRTGECMVRALDEDRLEVLRRQDGRTLEYILDRRI